MAQIVDLQNRGGYATYGAYQQPTTYQQPAAYPAFAPQQQFYSAYGASPAAFQGAYPGSFQQPRGRGMVMGGGRGGFGSPFRGGFQQQGYAPSAMGGFGGVGGYGRGAPFGMRARRKKPFVGGSLETQRQWEQQTLCCFFLQGQCKFSDGCRFCHEDDGIRGCQFGQQCRVGHGSREGATNGQQAQQPQQPQVQQQDAPQQAQ